MAIAFVQYNDTYFANVVAATAENLAYASNVTAGNLLFVFVAWTLATITATVSDSQGNSYSALPIMVNAPSVCQAFYCVAKASGANTVTAVFSLTGATFVQMSLAEYSADTIDVHAENAATSWQTGVPVTTTKTDVVIGYFNDGQRTGDAPNAPWVIRTNAAIAHRAWVVDQVNVAAGTYTPTFPSAVAMSCGTVGFNFIPLAGGTGGWLNSQNDYANKRGVEF